MDDEHIADLLIDVKTMTAAHGEKLDAIEKKMEYHIAKDNREHERINKHFENVYADIKELDQFKARTKGIGTAIAAIWGVITAALGAHWFRG